MVFASLRQTIDTQTSFSFFWIAYTSLTEFLNAAGERSREKDIILRPKLPYWLLNSAACYPVPFQNVGVYRDT